LQHVWVGAPAAIGFNALLGDRPCGAFGYGCCGGRREDRIRVVRRCGSLCIRRGGV